MKSILQEAVEIRGGERKADYGDAVENFDRIADIARTLTRKDLSPTDCCAVLLAVKWAREEFSHKRDNMVDFAGYTDIYHLIRERDVQPERNNTYGHIPEEAEYPTLSRQKKF